MPCISATAIRPSAMCGIFTTPTRQCQLACPPRHAGADAQGCASGTSAPPTGWTILSPTRIISPSASKSTTAVTAMSSTPAAISTKVPLSRRRTFTSQSAVLHGISGSISPCRPAPDWASALSSSAAGESWTSSRLWPARPWNFWAAAFPTRKCAATTCGPRRSFPG